MVVDVNGTDQVPVEGTGSQVAALPLLLTLFSILLSPLLYDLLQWVRRLLSGA